MEHWKQLLTFVPFILVLSSTCECIIKVLTVVILMLLIGYLTLVLCWHVGWKIAIFYTLLSISVPIQFYHPILTIDIFYLKFLDFLRKNLLSKFSWSLKRHNRSASFTKVFSRLIWTFITMLKCHIVQPIGDFSVNRQPVNKTPRWLSRKCAIN